MASETRAHAISIYCWRVCLFFGMRRVGTGGCPNDMFGPGLNSHGKNGCMRVYGSEVRWGRAW
eukprot:2258783-Alexandrium_andersonii.AAC.1